MNTKKRASVVSGFGALAAAALVLASGVTPAYATTATLTASQGGYSTVYYHTPRVNTYNKNAVSVRVTNNGSDYTPSFVMALRPNDAATGTYARTGSFSESTSYSTVYSDAGPAYVSGGTFYLSVSISGCMGPVGGCFGAQSGFGTWSGDIRFNIPVA